MLIALITILFLGGGSEDAVLDYTKHIGDSVDEVVMDDARRNDARATLKEIQKLTKDHSKSNNKIFKSLLSKMVDAETEIEAVDAIWDDYYQDVKAYNQQMIDLRFELRDTLTREEWEQLFGGSSE